MCSLCATRSWEFVQNLKRCTNASVGRLPRHVFLNTLYSLILPFIVQPRLFGGLCWLCGALGCQPDKNEKCCTNYSARRVPRHFFLNFFSLVPPSIVQTRFFNGLCSTLFVRNIVNHPGITRSPKRSCKSVAWPQYFGTCCASFLYSTLTETFGTYRIT